MSVIRLGVLGGTFNPIHRGHLHIARSVRKLFSLSEIRFVVAAEPPHKARKSLISLTHRYAMVCLATSRHPSFVPSLVELQPQASSYSVDTMRKLTRDPGVKGGEAYFIAGGDSLREMKSWRQSEKLLTAYNFIFVLRPGVDTEDFRNFLPEKAWKRVCDCTGLGPERIRRKVEEKRSGTSRLYIVDVDAPDISATGIRDRIASEKSFRNTVPGAVYDYIKKLGLYGD